MHSLSNQSRSDSSSSPPKQNRMSETAPSNDKSKNLIWQANSVPLPLVLNHYGILISERENVICCPFGSRHKNGKDRTPSFQYFPETNTYYCHGCTAGNRPVQFVSDIENITKNKAAYKIIGLHKQNIQSIHLDEPFIDKLPIFIDLSNYARQILKNNSSDQDVFSKVEIILHNFDKLYEKYFKKPSCIEGLKKLVEKTKEQIKTCL